MKRTSVSFSVTISALILSASCKLGDALDTRPTSTPSPSSTVGQAAPNPTASSATITTNWQSALLSGSGDDGSVDGVEDHSQLSRPNRLTKYGSAFLFEDMNGIRLAQYSGAVGKVEFPGKSYLRGMRDSNSASSLSCGEYFDEIGLSYTMQGGFDPTYGNGKTFIKAKPTICNDQSFPFCGSDSWSGRDYAIGIFSTDGEYRGGAKLTAQKYGYQYYGYNKVFCGPYTLLDSSDRLGGVLPDGRLVLFNSNSIMTLTSSSSNIFDQQKTVLAGGTTGYYDGIGSSAWFRQISDLEVLKDSIIVADSGNSRIRRVSFQGQVTTIGGGTATGSIDGLPSQSRFASPEGLTSDDSGNIYVADTGNHQIRMISGSNNETFTICGSAKGYIEGVGRSARFSDPSDVLFASRSLIVSDTGNNRLRILRPAAN